MHGSDPNSPGDLEQDLNSDDLEGRYRNWRLGPHSLPLASCIQAHADPSQPAHFWPRERAAVTAGLASPRPPTARAQVSTAWEVPACTLLRLWALLPECQEGAQTRQERRGSLSHSWKALARLLPSFPRASGLSFQGWRGERQLRLAAEQFLGGKRRRRQGAGPDDLALNGSFLLTI